MFEGFFRKPERQECQACKVYKEVLNDTQDLLAAERAERQLLEERLLRFIRVIPLESSTQPAVGPERISRRLDFNTIREQEEKRLASATPEGQSRRLYWDNKAKATAPELEKELANPVDEEARA